MSTDRLSIEQGKALAKAFERAGMQIADNVDKAIKRCCIKVEGTAKRKTHVDSGRLRASITHRVKKDSAFNTVGEVGTNVEYAPYEEFGTGKFAMDGNGRQTPWAYKDPKTGKVVWTAGQKPHPFLYPALEEEKEFIKNTIADAVKKVTR